MNLRSTGLRIGSWATIVFLVAARLGVGNSTVVAVCLSQAILFAGGTLAWFFVTLPKEPR